MKPMGGFHLPEVFGEDWASISHNHLLLLTKRRDKISETRTRSLHNFLVIWISKNSSSISIWISKKQQLQFNSFQNRDKSATVHQLPKQLTWKQKRRKWKVVIESIEIGITDRKRGYDDEVECV